MDEDDIPFFGTSFGSSYEKLFRIPKKVPLNHLVVFMKCPIYAGKEYVELS